MECFIVLKENVDLDNRQLRLVGEEAHHAVKSLRLRSGDWLMATDLDGMCYRCRIEERLRGIGDVATLPCRIEEELPEFGEPKRDILLMQGMISQPSRWEFLLEKATELGVRAIQPITTERTEREKINVDRSERILRAAVKQTKRARIPILRELSSFEEALNGLLQTEAHPEGRKLILLHEGEDISASLSSSNIDVPSLAIVVGPEGGFSDAEIRMAKEAGAEIRSLGPRRLRAETAAIAALAILMDDTR